MDPGLHEHPSVQGATRPCHRPGAHPGNGHRILSVPPHRSEARKDRKVMTRFDFSTADLGGRRINKAVLFSFRRCNQSLRVGQIKVSKWARPGGQKHGDWLKKNSKPDERLLGYEIGAIGYSSN